MRGCEAGVLCVAASKTCCALQERLVIQGERASPVRTRTGFCRKDVVFICLWRGKIKIQFSRFELALRQQMHRYWVPLG
jgi:hypothetical protein